MSATQRRSPLPYRRFIAVLLALSVGVLVWRTGAIGAVLGHNHSPTRQSAEAKPTLAPAPTRTPRPAVKFSVPGANPGADRTAVAKLIRARLPVFCGGRHARYVALTFDDGPSATTVSVLNLLRAAGAPATFFTIGFKIASYPGLVRQEASLGAVGNHTWDHVNLTKLPMPAQRSELQRTSSQIQHVTAARPMLFRPPLADHNAEVDHLVSSMGLLEVVWTVDSQDSLGASPARIIANVRSGIRPGAIILMHDDLRTTLTALPMVLRLVKDGGYTPVTVPELMRLDPPGPTQLRTSARTNFCVQG